MTEEMITKKSIRMTVADVIAQLQKYPPDLQVIQGDDFCGGYFPLTLASFQEIDLKVDEVEFASRSLDVEDGLMVGKALKIGG